MVKVNHITHKKSAVADKAPNAKDIVNGEIAVNYAKNTERMYIKNTSGEIIPFSSDHIIMDNILNIFLMYNTMGKIMGKGYDVSNPTLANVYGSNEALNMVLKHYKMGLFKDGALVKECAPCRITKAVDGSDININGSDGDIMLYTDVPIFRDRCNVSGVTVPDSTATTHNVIGLGLMPHKIGLKDAKKINPFAFTPGYVQFDGHEYRSCYNPSYSGSGHGMYDIKPLFKTNFIGEKGAQGGYPVMWQSSIDSMKYSRAKGDKYKGIFYEFYEMWMIAMYLELGSLHFTDIDSFGVGCTNATPNASNWISGGISGIRIKNGKGEGIDDYSPLMVYDYRIGSEGSTTWTLAGLLGDNFSNFEEALESQRFVDALVKSDLTDKVDGATVLEYDADKNNEYIKVSSNVDVASGSGMNEGKKYYVIRNVPKCQGIGDGVMTYVLNVFVKTSFNSGVTYDSVDVGNKEVIFKFSYPTYRGLELFSGAYTQIEGIHHTIGRYKDGPKIITLWYAKDFTDIKYDPKHFEASHDSATGKYTDVEVPIDTPDEDIPFLKGFVKVGEYDGYNYGWVKNANYDVSLYCATKCSGASAKSYECGYVDRENYPLDGDKFVTASVVGCGVYNNYPGRTLSAAAKAGDSSYYYAGGFSIVNLSL